MNPQRDRNILIALMAAQLALISRGQLQAVLRTWTEDKSQDIGILLRQKDFLDQENLDLLLALVDAHVAKNGGDASQSLATLSAISESVTEALAGVDDEELRECATELEHRRSATVVGYEQGNGAASQLKPPDIPRFSIIRRHAVGGLGEVFVAFDHELNRQVALKEIKGQHAFDAGSRQRFVLEAEITGGLEHPGIVPVYGLGTYQDGRPYYAMRFIKGSSLAETAEAFHKAHPHPSESDFRGHEFRKLLKRFTDVCYSIAYAHSRGVLHRDLKPGNIMLGKYGETLVVDWGLAKTVDRQKDAPAVGLDEETLRPSSGTGSSHTRLGQAVGTPAYMSPEAASGLVDQIGVPSDVYCLGATLYHVLTGKAPHKLDSEDKLASVKKGEFPSPRQHSPSIPKPLEAICLRAMRHDPADRYPSANAVAEDIDLWLADEPISAYEDPISVRLGRFLRRHKALVSSAAVIGLLTLLGVAVFALILNDKNRELELAKRKADDNAARATINARDADEQRRIATDNAETVRNIALNLVDIAENPRLVSNNPTQFRESQLDRALQTFREMYDTHPHDQDDTWDLARILRLTGNAKVRLQKYTEAGPLLEESLALQRELARNDTASLDYRAETYRDLASFGKSSGDLELAIGSFRQAEEILNGLLAAEPDNENFIRTLATCDTERIGLYLDLLDNEAALESATKAEAVYLSFANGPSPHPEDYAIATMLASRHGQALALLGRMDEAKVAYEEGIKRGREWLERDPTVDLRYMFARLLLYYATDLSELKPVPDEADALVDEAAKMLTNLLRWHKNGNYYHQLASARRTKAVIDHARSRNDAAQKGFDQAISIHEQLAKAAPTSPSFLSGLAKSYFLKAAFREAIDQKDDVIPLVTQAVARQKEVTTLNPGSLLDRKTLLEYEQKLAALQR